MLLVAMIACLLATPLFTQEPTLYKGTEEKLPRKVADQPVPFSHKKHYQVGIECLFCHETAAKSQRAGLPDGDDCISCHEEADPKSPMQIKLARLYGGDRLKWVRVYQLPDYIFFSHHNHLKAGIGCAKCHGPVKERDVLAKEISTSMTACMNCHAEMEVSNDCYLCHDLGQ